MRVKHSGNWKQVDKVFIRHNGVWKQVNKLFHKVNGVWKEGWNNAIEVPASSIPNRNINFNLFTHVGSPNEPVQVVFDSGNNKEFLSDNVNTPAFNVGNFVNGSEIIITFGTGTIVAGRGGDGGLGTQSEDHSGTNPQNGGTGFHTTRACKVTNNGQIAGGGGGGGRGGSRTTYNCSGSGGGGAGGWHHATTPLANGTGRDSQSIPSGYGGIGAGEQHDRNNSPRAGDGNLTTGGPFSNSSNNGTDRGGKGGDLGQAGEQGYGSTHNQGPSGGGSAGNAVKGNNLITWVTLGTITGNRVN
jgi:hypothetical protein